MVGVLTLSEMERAFPSEWILLENPMTNDAQEIQAGQVRFHSKDRDEVYRKAAELRPNRFALLFTGPLPKDMGYAL